MPRQLEIPTSEIVACGVKKLEPEVRLADRGLTRTAQIQAHGMGQAKQLGDLTRPALFADECKARALPAAWTTRLDTIF